MQPYGRLTNIKGSGVWKKDYHVRVNNRKIGNWWEDIAQPISKSRINQMVKRQIEKELEYTEDNAWEIYCETQYEIPENRWEII